MHHTNSYSTKQNCELKWKFYDDTKLLYLETDASGIGLGAALLQLRDNTGCQKDTAPDNTILHPVIFASKCLTGADQRYSNIECEVLGTLHGPEKFHHYCFGREVLVITDHKLLVSIFKKDIAFSSQQIQCILQKFTSIGFRLYTNLSLIFLLQIGCQDTTTQRGKTSL